jgi:hypothetical protein
MRATYVHVGEKRTLPLSTCLSLRMYTLSLCTPASLALLVALFEFTLETPVSTSLARRQLFETPKLGKDELIDELM